MVISSAKIADTTHEQRERLVKNAYALCQLDGPAPDEETMELAQQYIDGIIEAEDIEKKILQRYKKIKKDKI